jgi:hypothetical protein
MINAIRTVAERNWLVAFDQSRTESRSASFTEILRGCGNKAIIRWFRFQLRAAHNA